MGAAASGARVLLLFIVLTGIFLLVGWAIGAAFLGPDWIFGIIFFLVIAGLINSISYFFSDRLVLWSYRAKIVTEAESPRLYRTVQHVSQMAGLPMPRIAIVPSETPNAFATGRNPKHATVAATEGILRLLTDDELTGVLSHEMAHVKDRDILVMSVAATIAGAISFAARSFFWGTLFGGGNSRDGGNIVILLLVAITAPIAALMIQLAVSRSREYKADYEGARICGRPMSLASALRKLDGYNKAKPMQFGNPASSSLWIVNPFGAKGFVKLFSTHPPIEERIQRLEDMASGIRR